MEAEISVGQCGPIGLKDRCVDGPFEFGSQSKSGVICHNKSKKAIKVNRKINRIAYQVQPMTHALQPGL